MKKYILLILVFFFSILGLWFIDKPSVNYLDEKKGFKVGHPIVISDLDIDSYECWIYINNGENSKTIVEDFPLENRVYHNIVDASISCRKPLFLNYERIIVNVVNGVVKNKIKYVRQYVENI